MIENSNVDVLVVGGGPAGLVCADTIARTGISVVIVEKEPQIGLPVRTSGATTLKTMEEFGIPPELYHPVPRIRICAPNESAVYDYPEPVGCVIDVTGVYRLLAQRAQESGVTIYTGTRAVRPVLENGRVTGCEVEQDSKTYRIVSKVVIDAGGYKASISKQAGLHKGFTRFGIGAEYELLAPNCNQDELVLIVGSEFAPSGYGWIFPWGKNRVRIGVGILHADSTADPKKYLDVLINRAEKFSVDLRDSHIVDKHFGIVPSDGLASRMTGNGILAVGDAAGQASLIAGEGIRLSMLSGRLAGNVVSRAIQSGISLQQYEHAFRSRYGRNLAIGHAINVRIARWNNAKWDRNIRIFKDLPPDILTSALLSEFPFRDITAWIAGRPRLWTYLLYSTSKIIRTRLMILLNGRSDRR